MLRWQTLSVLESTPCTQRRHPHVCAVAPGRLRSSVRSLRIASHRGALRRILAAFSASRRESTPVIVLAGTCGGEGKSMLLKGLNSVFGTSAVLQKPEVRSFPLVDLAGKKVVLLDDWRFSQSILSYATQCLWYDGSAMSIVWPQNQPGVSGHYLYQGTAPILATTKARGIAALHSARSILSWAARRTATPR